MGRRRNSKRRKNKVHEKRSENNRDLDYTWNPFPNIDDKGRDGAHWDSDPVSDGGWDPDSDWDADLSGYDDRMDDDDALLSELVNDPSLVRRYLK
jgi:hypothetical protein